MHTHIHTHANTHLQRMAEDPCTGTAGDETQFKMRGTFPD